MKKIILMRDEQNGGRLLYIENLKGFSILIVVLRVANGSKEHSIGTHAHFVGSIRIGVADQVDGMGATDGFIIFKLMIELVGNGFENGYALSHNLWSDSVAREDGDSEFHNRRN